MVNNLFPFDKVLESATMGDYVTLGWKYSKIGHSTPKGIRSTMCLEQSQRAFLCADAVRRDSWNRSALIQALILSEELFLIYDSADLPEEAALQYQTAENIFRLVVEEGASPRDYVKAHLLFANMSLHYMDGGTTQPERIAQSLTYAKSTLVWLNPSDQSWAREQVLLLEEILEQDRQTA
ncbi:hypothetical protein HYV86_01140 [Candidatus Woesearchaeota archaeon]|nr:hypothetical protein [Candidatus Woesearchaeota archaeon]